MCIWSMAGSLGGASSPMATDASFPRSLGPRVGKLRPSQIVTQHGPGAVVDLPELSVIVAGINHWSTRESDRVVEPRLERFVRASGLYRPPVGPGQPSGVP